MIIRPEISVIFALDVYEADLLRRSIESILCQSFPDFELILIDDQNCPYSTKICQEYACQDARVKHVESIQSFKSCAERYNHGVTLSSGNFLCFMSKNDEWFPNALAVLYKRINDKNLPCKMAYANLNYPMSLQVKKNDVWFMQRIKYEHLFAKSALIIKRAVFLTLGGYQEHPAFKDTYAWDLWKCVIRYYPIAPVTAIIGTTQEVLKNQSDFPLLKHSQSYSVKNQNNKLPIFRPLLVDFLQSSIFYGSKDIRKWLVLWHPVEKAWRFSRRGMRFIFRFIKT